MEDKSQQGRINNPFPILGVSRQQLHPGTRDWVPWEFLQPHEKRAVENHDQSLQQLKNRGGLCWSEIWLIINDKPWFEGERPLRWYADEVLKSLELWERNRE